jgi:hypothetical protein
MQSPQPTAPRIPAGYGVPTNASGAGVLPWAWAVERLESARNYWICTTRADGRPHAAPVWAVWVEGVLWFSTSPVSQKGKNLERDPRVLVHLDGDDVVILEGEAARVDDVPTPVLAAYEAKYSYRLDPANADTPVFAVHPRIAQTWTERGFPGNAARWVFGY